MIQIFEVLLFIVIIIIIIVPMILYLLSKKVVNASDKVITHEADTRILGGLFVAISWVTISTFIALFMLIDPIFPDSFILFLLYLFPILFLIFFFFLFDRYFERKYHLTSLTHRYKKTRYIVKKLSKRIGVKNPQIYQSSQVKTMFVYGRTRLTNRLVIPTSKINKIERTIISKPDNELKKIEIRILHELAHIKNGDVAFISWGEVLTKVYSAWILFMIIVEVAFWIRNVDPMVYGGGAATLINIHLAPMFLGSFLIFYHSVNFVSRVREYQADARTSLYVSEELLQETLLEDSVNTISSQIYDAWAKQKRPKSLYIKEKVKNITSRFSETRFFYYFNSTHPTATSRIDSLRGDRYLRKDEIYIPSDSSFRWIGVYTAPIYPTLVVLFICFYLGGGYVLIQLGVIDNLEFDSAFDFFCLLLPILIFALFVGFSISLPIIRTNKVYLPLKKLMCIISKAFLTLICGTITLFLFLIPTSAHRIMSDGIVVIIDTGIVISIFYTLGIIVAILCLCLWVLLTPLIKFLRYKPLT